MNKMVSVIGVPMDLGQNRRGVDMGPSAMRYAGLVERLQETGCSVNDLGDIEVGRPEALDVKNADNLKDLEEVVTVNERLADTVKNVVQAGRFPLILGGDHSIAIGTLAGVSHKYNNMGVIWYDAHGDLNTGATSPSGNIHGMPLAVSLGIGHPSLTEIGGYKPKVTPENIVIIGARSLDPEEREYIQAQGVRVYTMHEIDRDGMAAVMNDAIAFLEAKTDGVHLSLDLDALDPQHAPGVGTPVVGGTTYRETHLAMEMLAQRQVITSAEFVEVNPILDVRNQTAEAAVGLIGSLFGEKLL
ncbi:arginase [Salisediminibacterium halotolerans]|nr:arginase [Actinophytocola xinjiangensis]RPE86710.1 arginase [Salisediminibacterium halotolerans]TWG34085.1 arginase [Salisediminibacterium halotolerans]GEL07599.1 arginase [Salisediminibacterium halotolerans]